MMYLPSNFARFWESGWLNVKHFYMLLGTQLICYYYDSCIIRCKKYTQKECQA